MTDPVPEADALEQRRAVDPAQAEADSVAPLPPQPERTDDEAPEEDSLEQSLPVDIDEEEWAHDEEE